MAAVVIYTFMPFLISQREKLANFKDKAEVSLWAKLYALTCL